MPIIPVVLVLM